MELIMTKIEIIHNKEILNLLKTSMRNEEKLGFTTIMVHEGYGPLKGEYKEDHIGDQQFYTIILFDNEKKAEDTINLLHKKAPTNNFLAFKSVAARIK
jgi:nitrogen regulatory protein PII